MIITLSILCVLFFASTCFFAFLTYRSANMLMQIEDNAQTILDVMDFQLENTFTILSEVYLEHDETFVKFMTSLKQTRAILEKAFNSLIASSEEFELQIGEDLIASAQKESEDANTVTLRDTA